MSLEVKVEGIEYKAEEAKDGVVEVKAVDSDLYVKKAEEAGIDKKTLKQVADFEVAYMEAVTEKAADQAIDILKKDESVNKVIVHSPFGVGKQDQIETHIKREVSGPIPGTDKTYRKSQIVNVVKAKRYKMPKSRIKAIAEHITEKVLNS